MLKAKHGKGRDGQPHCHSLARHVLGSVGLPSGNAHQPVGENAADERLSPAIGDLFVSQHLDVLLSSSSQT